MRFGEYDEAWVKAWGIEQDKLPAAKTLEEARKLWKKRQPNARKGECWLREGQLCPFSVVELEKVNSSIDACGQHLAHRTIKEISRIHTCCEKRATHEG